MARFYTLARRSITASLVCAVSALPVGVACADSITDGYFVAIGDSYTGPYTGNGAKRGNHRSWLEQLDSFNTSGSFQNLGVSGSTTQSAQTFGDSHYQLGAALNTIHGNGAGVVVIGLGVNDFTSVFESGTAMTQAQADAVADAAFSSLSTLVDTILDPATGNASARIVISNSVDRTQWAISSTSDYDLNREVTSAAIQRFNQLVADEFAGNRGLAVVDSYRLLEDLLAGDPADSNAGAGPNGELFIAGQQIDIDPLNALKPDGTGATRQPSDHLWADGAHPGSIYQGLYANVVLTALQEMYGIDPGTAGMMSIADIFAASNALNPADGVLLTVSDADYTFDYAQYITPEPGSAAVLVVAGLVLSRRRRG
ncbi:MAG: SGNH/GDSL hydrolase family protein [Phycisphaerales bacterium JB063]